MAPKWQSGRRGGNERSCCRRCSPMIAWCSPGTRAGPAGERGSGRTRVRLKSFACMLATSDWLGTDGDPQKWDGGELELDTPIANEFNPPSPSSSQPGRSASRHDAIMRSRATMTSARRMSERQAAMTGRHCRLASPGGPVRHCPVRRQAAPAPSVPWNWRRPRAGRTRPATCGRVPGGPPGR
jgi:hypothetical protein